MYTVRANNLRDWIPRAFLPGFVLALWTGAEVFAAPVQANKATGPLKIVDVFFEDYDGWPAPRLIAPAGSEAVLNFRMDGFERLEGRDANDYPEYRVRLRYDVELRDPEGVLVVPAEEGQIQPVLGPQDDTWSPLVRWSAAIPAWAPSGDYAIHIRARDEIGEQDTEHTATLQVRGERLQATDELQTDGLEFGRTPDGPWTSTRYFALDDPVYVRFHVVGYRVSPQKRVWVEQDWTVLDEEGNVIIRQENAVQDQLREFYPPRFLTTNFHVEFDDPQPGSYTLQVDLRDRVGDQAYSQEVQFNLRP
jgi:hypothetical protein